MLAEQTPDDPQTFLFAPFRVDHRDVGLPRGDLRNDVSFIGDLAKPQRLIGAKCLGDALAEEPAESNEEQEGVGQGEPTGDNLSRMQGPPLRRAQESCSSGGGLRTSSS